MDRFGSACQFFRWVWSDHPFFSMEWRAQTDVSVYTHLHPIQPTRNSRMGIHSPSVHRSNWMAVGCKRIGLFKSDSPYLRAGCEQTWISHQTSQRVLIYSVKTTASLSYFYLHLSFPDWWVENENEPVPRRQFDKCGLESRWEAICNWRTAGAILPMCKWYVYAF